MKLRIAMLLAAVAAFTVMSCDHDEIRLEMIPRDTGMYRQIIVYRTGDPAPQSAPAPTAWQLEQEATDVEVVGDIPTSAPAAAKMASPELLAQICPHYATTCRAQGNDNIMIFRGQFKEKLPADVGNGGTYAIYRSSLGNVYFYVETFRGEMDLLKSEQARFAAIDRVVTLLTGWMESKLGREKDFAAVAQFMNTDVRRDLRNLSLHLSMRQANEDRDGGMGDLVLLLYQYAAQRGYLKPSDVPSIVEAVHDGPLPPAIRAKIGGLLKLPADSPKLAFLASREQAGETMGAYLASLPEYQQRLSAWKQDQATTQAAAKSKASGTPAEPTPFVLLEEPVKVLQNDLAPPQTDNLTISLASPQQPFQTNGEWDQVGARVVWRKTLPGREYQTAYPIESEAAWANPNVEFQRAHFGSVLFDNDDLFTYVMWRLALPARDGEAWDAMLNKTDPDKAFEAVAGFRFPSQGKATSAPSYIELGREVMMQKLENAPPPAF